MRLFVADNETKEMQPTRYEPTGDFLQIILSLREGDPIGVGGHTGVFVSRQFNIGAWAMCIYLKEHKFNEEQVDSQQWGS